MTRTEDDTEAQMWRMARNTVRECTVRSTVTTAEDLAEDYVIEFACGRSPRTECA